MPYPVAACRPHIVPAQAADVYYDIPFAGPGVVFNLEAVWPEGWPTTTVDGRPMVQAPPGAPSLDQWTFETFYTLDEGVLFYVNMHPTAYGPDSYDTADWHAVGLHSLVAFGEVDGLYLGFDNPPDPPGDFIVRVRFS